jgi:hypothetical protein
MSKNSRYVSKWRRSAKLRMVEAFGGICCLCKKVYPQELFEFHHLDPKEKSFSLGNGIRSNCIAWEKIVDELRKCVMVCANCHRMVEYGYEKLPPDVMRFNESYREYKKPRYDICTCGKPKLKRKKYCSTKCYNLHQRRSDWPTEEEMRYLITEYSLVKIAKIFSVNYNTVKKWKKFYNL